MLKKVLIVKERIIRHKKGKTRICFWIFQIQQFVNTYLRPKPSKCYTRAQKYYNHKTTLKVELQSKDRVEAYQKVAFTKINGTNRTNSEMIKIKELLQTSHRKRSLMKTIGTVRQGYLLHMLQ